MLRRSQAIKLPPDDVGAMRAEIERAFTPNPELRDPTQLPPEIERPFQPRMERGADARPRMRASLGLRPTRVVLIAVAIVAGGIAAYLSMQRDQPVPAPTTEIVTEVAPPPPSMKVLVARGEIGVGQKISAETVEWADWPEQSVRAEFITDQAMPDAVAMMTGSIARYEFFPGEPIREAKLAQPGDGYLSVVLENGMRALSVTVTPESASGGFILPNDRVDVVLTRGLETGPLSTTILSNVRVLAINQQLGGTKPAEGEAAEEQTTGFAEMAIATLALDQAQAEILVSAQALGKLTLVLRPMMETSANSGVALSAANQAIRMTSPFWTR